MTHHRMAILSAVVAALSVASALAAGPKAPSTRPTTIMNTEFLEQYAATNKFGLGKPTAIKLTPDGKAVLFLRAVTARSFVQNLYEFDVTTGRERDLLTAEQILRGAQEQLSEEEKARRERMRMTSRGIASYALSEDGGTIVVPLSGRLFVIDRASGRATEIVNGSKGYPIDPQLSPDGKRLACVRDGDLYVYELATGAERRLTSDGGGPITNGLAEFAAQEEMHRHTGFWWSPESDRIACQRTDTTGLETFHIADPARPQATPTSWPYPRAGRKNAVVTLGIIPVAGDGGTTWVRWDNERHPYLATVRWSKNAPLTLLVQDRAQHEELLLSVDSASGRTTTLLVERDDAWLNLDQTSPRWLEDGSGFLWTTERGGAWQLELRGRDGALLRTLTEPEFGLRGIASIDNARRLAYISASAEPTESHLWRVSIDAPAKRDRLTTARGSHSAIVAKHGDAMVLASSPADGPAGWAVKNADGTDAGALRSIAETPLITPAPQWLTVGPRQFRASVIRPRDFVAGRKYPVILSVYGGPHGMVVNATRDAYLQQQWLADQGFIVVASDGRGTPNRGRAWERETHLNFIDKPLEDQVATLRAVAEQCPEMDLSRVGITGWSFGGYFTAMAVMRRPDVFKAGFAGAPVADFADYDTHYTERYLGMPDENVEGYKACNVLTYAADLSRPLLIVHGTSDDNVYFLHSLKLTQALFRAGKPFEFVPLSGFTHMVPDPLVTVRLQTLVVEFFKRNL